MSEDLNTKAQKIIKEALGEEILERKILITNLCDGNKILEETVYSYLETIEDDELLFTEQWALDPTLVADTRKLYGHYRIEGKIGEGSMGMIFQARDTRLDRNVALKFLTPALKNDESAKARFLAEAKAISKIEHPNVCEIYDIGDMEEEQLYFVMPFYVGKSLKDVLNAGTIDIETALEYMIQITKALKAAHQKDVIHRDVKPANIFITTEGTLKVLDFGIAKMVDVDLTLPGQVVGTLVYMSPEQLQQQPYDHRTDIWSLGVVFYEIITGFRPFMAKNVRDIKKQIVECEPPQISFFVEHIPEQVDIILSKTVNRDPDERYNSAQELIDALKLAQKEDYSKSKRKKIDSIPQLMDNEEGDLPLGTMQEPAKLPVKSKKGLFIGIAIAVVVLTSVFLNSNVRDTIMDKLGMSSQAQSDVRGISQDEIKFGMTAPFSGANKELGRSMQIGIQLRFMEINDNGGIHGRELKLIALDDGYEPAKAKENLKDFFDAENGTFALIGNVGTPTAQVIIPEALKGKTIVFGTFSGAGLLRNVPPDKYIFNYRASYADETSALVKYFVEIKDVAPAKIAVFYQNDGYGQDGLSGVEAALRKQKVKHPLVKATYERNTADIQQALDIFKPKLEEIEAIIIVSTYKASASFTKALRDLNYKGEIANVSFVGSEALEEEFKLIGQKYGEGVLVSQVVPHYESYAEGVIKYREALKKYFPSEAPNFISLEAYITASIFCEAIQQAGRVLDTDTLIEALYSMEKLNLGIGPTISFDKSNHQASHYVWITEIQKDGSFKSIKVNR